MIRVNHGCILALLASQGITGAALAQQPYPSQVIRVISPFAAGGSTDILARLFSAKLNEAWKQPVIVENRPGAAGNTGGNVVARAKPDGYTLLITASNLAINVSVYKEKMPFDTTRDLAAVALFGKAPNVLLVHPALPVNNVRDLIRLAKDRNGKLDYGSGGSGTATHIMSELFNDMAGAKIQHIPYNGSGPAIAALIKGEVSVYFSPMVTAMAHVKAGKVKLLATTSSERNKTIPDTPTVIESGLPGFDADNWYGMMTTGKTPPEIVLKINQEINNAMRDPKVSAALVGLGISPTEWTPDQFGNFIKSEIVKWGKAVELAGAQPE